MTEWLLMVLEDEAAHAALGGAELAEARARFAEELRRTGQLVDSGRFRPSREGKRVSSRGVASGPFAEDGKALGAYYCVRAESADDAAKIASGVPALPSDEIDVRPVMRSSMRPDDGTPGNVFAFAVLGNAPNEAAWVEVMNRIEAAGSGRGPSDHFAGGVRLQPPTSGKRVATKGERRVMLDGPFLESKEVIGGLFLLRLESIDEAVAWVSGKPFLAHGSVEIRALGARSGR